MFLKPINIHFLHFRDFHLNPQTNFTDRNGLTFNSQVTSD